MSSKLSWIFSSPFPMDPHSVHFLDGHIWVLFLSSQNVYWLYYKLHLLLWNLKRLSRNPTSPKGFGDIFCSKEMMWASHVTWWLVLLFCCMTFGDQISSEHIASRNWCLKINSQSSSMRENIKGTKEKKLWCGKS